MGATRRSTSNKVFMVTRNGRLKSILSPRFLAKTVRAKGVLTDKLAALMRNANAVYDYISVNSDTGEVEMVIPNVMPLGIVDPEAINRIVSIAENLEKPKLSDFPPELQTILSDYMELSGSKLENVLSPKGIGKLKEEIVSYWDSPEAIQEWIRKNIDNAVIVKDVKEDDSNNNLVIGVWADRQDINASNVRSVIKSRIKPLIKKRMTQEMVKRMSNKAELNYAQTWVMIDSKLSEGRLDVMRSASSLKSALENIRSAISEYPEYLEKDLITEEFNEIAGKLDDTVKMLEETEEQMETWVMRAYDKHG